MSMIYGYARCSLAEEKGQDLNRQVRELKAAGAEEIITEREHGDAKVKQNLDLLLEAAEIGSTIDHHMHRSFATEPQHAAAL